METYFYRLPFDFITYRIFLLVKSNAFLFDLSTAQSFSEAFSKLGNEEQQELASYSNKGESQVEALYLHYHCHSDNSTWTLSKKNTQNAKPICSLTRDKITGSLYFESYQSVSESYEPIAIDAKNKISFCWTCNETQFNLRLQWHRNKGASSLNRG